MTNEIKSIQWYQINVRGIIIKMASTQQLGGAKDRDRDGDKEGDGDDSDNRNNSNNGDGDNSIK